MKHPGKLITFEGLDGCGKSTQLELEAVRLRALGIPIITTQEPGGTPLGQQIRDLVVRPAPDGLTPYTELALLFAARAQHVSQVVLPALRSGQVVLCDRFTDSSFAYQGYGRGLPMPMIRTLEDLFCHGVRPDLTVILNVEPETAARRTAARNRTGPEADSRFEREGRIFFERVQQCYLELARQEPERVRIVNAEGPIPEVHEQVRQLVDALLQATR